MDHSNAMVLFLPIYLASAASHSLRYFCTAVTPEIHFPEFTAVSLVDGDQFMYYDSNIRKRILNTDCIKKIDCDDPDWDTRQIQERTKEIFNDNGATAKTNISQTEGVHTVQVMYGCELNDNGTKSGFEQYGYDGEDYISLDLNTHTWTAANDKAVITKYTWDSDIDNTMAKINYLENTCIEWLQKCVSYGRDTLERKVSPEVSLFQKDSSSPVVCHATGFFPRGVEISWQKNGEDLHENVNLTETLPNQDGTFQKRSILTVSPEELDRNDYTCVVQHSGLEKEGVLRVTERRVLNTGGVSVGVIVGVVVSLLLVLIGCVVFFIWRKKKKNASAGESWITVSM